MAVAQATPRWQLTVADEPRYIEGVATTLVLRFKVRAGCSVDAGTALRVRTAESAVRGATHDTLCRVSTTPILQPLWVQGSADMFCDLHRACLRCIG